MIHFRKHVIRAFEYANPFTKLPIDIRVGDILILSQNQNELDNEMSQEDLLGWIKLFFDIKHHNQDEYEIMKPVFLIAA